VRRLSNVGEACSTPKWQENRPWEKLIQNRVLGVRLTNNGYKKFLEKKIWMYEATGSWRLLTFNSSEKQLAILTYRSLQDGNFEPVSVKKPVRLCKYLQGKTVFNPWLADFHTETKKNMLFLWFFKNMSTGTQKLPYLHAILICPGITIAYDGSKIKFYWRLFVVVTEKQILDPWSINKRFHVCEPMVKIINDKYKWKSIQLHYW
jgi:hypothetical protein